jgi:hypothetical protein
VEGNCPAINIYAERLAGDGHRFCNIITAVNGPVVARYRYRGFGGRMEYIMTAPSIESR